MKRFKLLAIGAFAAAFFYLTFPQTADASGDQDNGITLLQILVGLFVMGWYLTNHFKDRIKNLFSKRKGDEKAED